MRILVTAIGSMSAPYVIKSLRSYGHFVLGTDIYPGKWHFETRLCDAFRQAPLATQQDEYIKFLTQCCYDYNLDTILPLTDLEIDIINTHREAFKNNILLAMPDANILNIARDKYKLYEQFKNDDSVSSIKTIRLIDFLNDSTLFTNFPCVAKTYNGRSSEGLIKNAFLKDIKAVENPNSYIIQEQIEGSIVTVDYVRSSKYNIDVSIAREELLRTKNGAGMTVRVFKDDKLVQLSSHIGNVLNINSAINMEFISASNGNYYLIDVNPRFSAGIAYSKIAGYDMVRNHFNALSGQIIEPQIHINELYITKHWEESIL